MSNEQCPSESPSWGYESEGERCELFDGHEGPHQYEDADCTLQWTWKPENTYGYK